MEFEAKTEIKKVYINDYIVGKVGDKYHCQCQGFAMSRKKIKTCKHIEEFKRQEIFVQDRIKLENILQKLVNERNKIINDFKNKHKIVKRIEVKENEDFGSVFVELII